MVFDQGSLHIQLTWRRKEGVPKMIVSHCVRIIVTAGDKRLEETRALGGAVEVAYDR